MSRHARLTADLLARKGEAMPSCGPAQATSDDRGPPPIRAAVHPLPGTSGAVIPIGASSISARRGARPAGVAASATPPGGEARVALTLRLDRRQHTRLRIFAARHRATNQDVLVRALDAYMQSCGGDCPCLGKGPAEHVADD